MCFDVLYRGMTLQKRKKRETKTHNDRESEKRTKRRMWLHVQWKKNRERDITTNDKRASCSVLDVRL